MIALSYAHDCHHLIALIIPTPHPACIEFSPTSYKPVPLYEEVLGTCVHHTPLFL